MTRGKAALRSGAPRAAQRGFAIMVIVALIVLVSAYFLANGLNRTSAQISNDREARTMAALLKAKSALIAYAASEAWQSHMGQSTGQPGSLPCPDRDSDGDSDCVWGGITNSVSLIGLLPYTTLGTEDLRDASGERLWYAVSRNFRKLSGVTVVNSDTQGQFTVTGTTTASNVVAVVIAPGPVIQGQNRSSGTPSPGSYLESFNANDGVNFIFTTNALPTQTLNDRLITITQADLMAAVEPAVAARIDRDIKPTLQTYLSQWGALPFPVQFDISGIAGFSAVKGPGSSGTTSTRPPTMYVGTPGQTSGLLPIAGASVSGATNATPIVITTTTAHGFLNNDTVWIYGVQGNTAANGRWTVTTVDATRFQLNGSTGNNPYTSGGTVTPGYPWSNWTLSLVSGTGRVRNLVCTTASLAASPKLTCGFQVDDGGGVGSINNPTFKVQATAGNAGRMFSVPPNLASVVFGIFPSCGAGCTAVSPSLSASLDNQGNGIIAYKATLPINCTSCSYIVSVAIPDVIGTTVTSAADASAGWFIANEWYRQTYYSVSDGYLPGGSGSCSPLPASPSCLTVKNLSPAYATANDKRVILILAGRSLNGSTRPSSTVGDYLEGVNATFASNPYIFENRIGVPTSINDRVVVVSP
jgi:hypothetical protein